MKRPLNLWVLAVALLSSVALWAVTTGPNYAGAAGTNSFTSPANAVGPEELLCAGDNYGLAIVSGFWNTFGFAIPSGDTIDGIQVEVKWSDSQDPGLAGDHGVNIGKNETTLGTEKTPAAAPAIAACGTGQTITSFGGAADKWGFASITPAEVNATTFSVRIRKSILGTEHGLFINWIRVTVFHTAGGAPAKKNVIVISKKQQTREAPLRARQSVHTFNAGALNPPRTC